MTINETPSATVLEETPARALTFLRGIATTPPLYALLGTRGYSPAVHAEGWRLLHKASGFDLAPPSGLEDSTVRDAIAEIDAWDEPNFRWIKAALARKFPAQAAFVFENLESATGAGAVLGVSTLLDRLDALQSGHGRSGTRRDDHAALDLLAQRGFTADERRRLRGVVETAQRVPNAPPAADPSASQHHEADLVELRGWYNDWSETARAWVKRRDYLLRLGLARRKVRKKKSEPTEGPK